MSSCSRILERIVRQAGVPDMLHVLSEKLSATDLASVLLAVFAERASGVLLPALLQDGKGLFAPSSVDQRLFHQFDGVAFAAANGFEAVEVSPVCPLGTNHVLGGIHQNSILSATRNSELLADPTAAHALECARRRRVQRSHGKAREMVKLCGSHRVVRMQPFDVPGYRPHFRLFSLITAGRDTGSDTFETEASYEHLAVYLRLLRSLERNGYRFERLAVEISDTDIVSKLLQSRGIDGSEIRRRVRSHALGSSKALLEEFGISLPQSVDDPARELGDLAKDYSIEPIVARLARVRERVVLPLREEFPGLPFKFDLSRLEGLGYYSGLCLRISATDPAGLRLPFGDGGFTNWTQLLLSDRKERLLISGIGTEAICGKFRS